MKLFFPSACLVLITANLAGAFQPPRRKDAPSTLTTGPLPAATAFSRPTRTSSNDDGESSNGNGSGSPLNVNRAVHVPASQQGQQPQKHELTQQQRRRQQKRRQQNAARLGYQVADDDAAKRKELNLLEEFSTANGDVVDPYKILKVPRDADRRQVRQAYVALSKRYHPDGARNMKFLPGNCNNLDEVRDQWERIKLSYEILSDKKTRLRYDRHIVISDPGAALQRATLNAMGSGIMGLGKGLFNVGAMAVSSIATAVTDPSEKGEMAKNTDSPNDDPEKVEKKQ